MSFSHWLEGARPHTWANAIAPVIAGTGAALAAAPGQLELSRTLLALTVSLSLIIGVNYANDYSDGIRGTDDDRSGPLRLTASGVVPAQQVKRAAFIAFGVAAVAGITLCMLSGQWWLILVGAAAIAAAWFYTGGDNPYGYRGLGEVSVFIFFGLVAVLGTQLTQLGTITAAGVVCAVSVGSFSCAVNLANNIRDIPTDKEAGKITLAVRLGDRLSRALFAALVAIPFVGTLYLSEVDVYALLGFLAAPLAFVAALPVVQGAAGKALIPVLGKTGKAMLWWTIITAIAIGL